MAIAPRQNHRPERGTAAEPARTGPATERGAGGAPAASAWGAPLTAKQAWVDASPRMALQRQSLAAVMPLQRKPNTWLGHQNVKATPLREEIQTALQLPDSDLGEAWGKAPLAGIASQQASQAYLPTGAAAKLSQIFTDRGSNPSAVSVHADIGNLEAALRKGGASPSTGSISPQQAPQGQQPQSPLDAAWQKELTLKAGKRADRRNEEAAYQAGHLVAYQMMGDAANVFQNVAPQGAQLNNVAFQNWEAGVVAGSVKALRGQLGEAVPEDQVPYFFDYEVRVTYPGDKYRVPVGTLEAQGLLRPGWKQERNVQDLPAEVPLTKRIPLSWEARATPTSEAAQEFAKQPASYGIVGADGQVSRNTHFTATGPRSLVGGPAAGRVVRSLARQSRPSGLEVVVKALNLVQSKPEDAEQFIQGTARGPSDELAAAILAMPSGAFRTDYANRLGTEKPMHFDSAWADPVTGKTYAAGEILQLAQGFAEKKAWADTEAVAKLRREQTAARRKYEELKQTRRLELEKQAQPSKDAAKQAGADRDQAFKDHGKDSDAYRQAHATYQQKIEERDKKATEIAEAIKQEFERISLEMEKVSAQFDGPIEEASRGTPAAVLRRYLDDVLDLQDALARLQVSLTRRATRRSTEPAPPVADPRDIDFLDPEPLPEHKAPAPLHFSAQDTQP